MMDESRREPQERPLWELNRDDQRSLLITLAATFIGGVASIVVGATVIGLAFAAARGYGRHLRGASGVAATASIFGLTILVVAVAAFRPDVRSSWLWCSLVFMMALCGWLLLLWIGIAVGIHPSG